VISSPAVSSPTRTPWPRRRSGTSPAMSSRIGGPRPAGQSRSSSAATRTPSRSSWPSCRRGSPAARV